MQTVAGWLIIGVILFTVVGMPAYWVWQRRQRIRVERTGELRQALVLQSKSVWRRDGPPDFKLLLRVPQKDGSTRDQHITASFGGSIPLPPQGSTVTVAVDPSNEHNIYLADQDAFNRTLR